MELFISAEELWEKVDMSGQLDEDVVQVDEFGDFIYKQIYFNSIKFKDGVCRNFGVFAYPKSIVKPMPCILLIHDFGAKIEYSYMDYFLNLGIAVFMVDSFGNVNSNSENIDTRHTIFPPSHSYLNYHAERVDDDTLPLEDSYWFNMTLIQRHALKYLRSNTEIDPNKIAVFSFGISSICGFQLSFCEKYLAFSCCFHYGGWKGFESLSNNIEAHKVKYIMATAPQTYSPLAKTPLFFIGSTNTDLCDSDRCFDTMARANGEVTSFLYLSPNYIHTLDHFATRNMRLILNKYLLGADIVIPTTPHLKYEITDDEILFSCISDEEFPVSSISILYTQGDKPSHLRSYVQQEMVKVAGSYTVNIAVSSSLSTIAFANVKYSNGISISSKYLKIEPFGTGLKKTTVVCSGTDNSFFSLGALKFPKANQFFKEKNPVTMALGAFDIYGVQAPRLATFQIGNPLLLKKSKSISLQIYSENPQEIRLILSCSQSSEQSFSSNIKMVGGDLWQQIILKDTDFVSANLKYLESFEEINLMFFVSEYNFLVSNISFV